jgi:hypothetical protein
MQVLVSWDEESKNIMLLGKESYSSETVGLYNGAIFAQFL